MSANFLQILFTSEAIKALCWTLIHSMWQGLVFAMIAAFVILLTKKSAPSLRYNILTCLFVLFLVSVGITFARQWLLSGKADSIPVAATTHFAEERAAIHNTGMLDQPTHRNYVDSAVAYFNEHASLIVLIWFIIFSVRLIRILGHLGYIRRIRYYKTHVVTDYWRNRLKELSQNLYINRYVRLLESEIVKVPLVIGFLKPIIIVPLGLLANLPANQVEAILLHELAHICRKDYFINLLQSFAETIFFFNPGLLWISDLMRAERENCCDELAIGQLANKHEFIQALVAFQEYNISILSPKAHLAFAGRKNHLLYRVKRILHNENKKLNAMEKGIFIASIFAVSLIGLIAMKKAPVQLPTPVFTSILQDTVPAKPDTVQSEQPQLETEFTDVSYNERYDNGKRSSELTVKAKSGNTYSLERADGNITGLSVNGQVIPAQEYSKYKTLIDQLTKLTENKRTEGRRRAGKDLAKQKEMLKKQEKNLEKLKRDQGEQQDRLEEVQQNNQNLMEQKEYALKQYKLKQSENLKSIENLKESKMEMLQQQNLMAAENFKSLQNKQMTLQNEKMELLKQQQLKQFENPKSIEFKLTENETGSLVASILDELSAAGLIDDKDEVAFELTDHSLFVNGKKQAAEVHEKFKKRFLHSSGDYVKYKYSKKSGSRSTTINQE